ncbi:MAG: DUF1292 domain-containing protein [Acholeplasmatales bacterium]|jgi:hypothetical protein|nr:DUF1292 domain-containing protein [Acholeplasmatales bacterium]
MKDEKNELIEFTIDGKVVKCQLLVTEIINGKNYGIARTLEEPLEYIPFEFVSDENDESNGSIFDVEDEDVLDQLEDILNDIIDSEVLGNE